MLDEVAVAGIENAHVFVAPELIRSRIVCLTALAVTWLELLLDGVDAEVDAVPGDDLLADIDMAMTTITMMIIPTIQYNDFLFINLN
jgi:hypothetical protein